MGWNRHLIARMAALIVIGLLLAGRADAREERFLSHGGLQRSYLIETPDISAPGARPLVVLLHGGTQSASRVWRQTTLPELARQDGFILAAPNALDGHWNDHRSVQFGTDRPPDADDVGFIGAMIDDIIARDGADPRRVFVVGASNGGFMSFRVACEMTGRIAAIGAVIAAMPVAPATYCQPAVAMPVIMIAGTDDPYIPFAGGTVTVRGRTAEPTASVPDVARFWATHNGCNPAPTIATLANGPRLDRSTVQRWAFENCTSGAPVLLYVVEGGGHMWPTSGRLPSGTRLAQTILGPVNRDIDAGTVIWDFFSRFWR